MTEKTINKSEPLKLTPDLFEPVPQDEAPEEHITRPTINYWADVWRRLKQDKLAMIGLIIIIVMVVLAIFGPMMTGMTYEEQNYAVMDEPPGSEYWFGTDNLGRYVYPCMVRNPLFLGNRYLSRID